MEQAKSVKHTETLVLPLDISNVQFELQQNLLRLLFRLYSMGSQLCPATNKDLIQNLADFKNADDAYQTIFKGLLSHNPAQIIQPNPSTPYYQENLDKQHNYPTHSPFKSHTILTTNESFSSQLKLSKNPSHYQPNQFHQQTSATTVINLLLEDGWRYSGQAIEGLPQGKGEEHGPNGDYYIGDFRRGKKCGNGTYKFADSAIYKGDFRENLMWGRGSFEFANGDHFQGSFVNNVREGWGKYIPRQPNIDGMLYFEGEYSNDMKNGAGVLRYEHFEVRGHWKDGCYDYSIRQ